MPLRQPPDHPALKRRILRAALALLPAQPTIVEVGTTRFARDTDDGRATLLFAEHARRAGGRVHSVDVDPAAVEVAREALAAAGVAGRAEVHEADGVGFLKSFGGPIDLLYLDSSDDPADSLAQLRAAWPALAARAVVVVDDCQAYLGNEKGKGTLALPRLGAEGWPVWELWAGKYRLGLAARDPGAAGRLRVAALRAGLALSRARASGQV